MIADSSIHGTGAQNFASAMRQARIVVSGIALWPHWAALGLHRS
jgi:hypothetical protein